MRRLAYLRSYTTSNFLLLSQQLNWESELIAEPHVHSDPLLHRPSNYRDAPNQQGQNLKEAMSSISHIRDHINTVGSSQAKVSQVQPVGIQTDFVPGSMHLLYQFPMKEESQ